MDSHQDHKTAPTSTGHEVHICRRCRWPFPNPHPSSKHRRAHKRVCGTVEGYKVIHSEEEHTDRQLSVSDDEHVSDGEKHTPSPDLVKKKAEDFASGGGVGAKSNRSEDDVFSDAVTDFSDGSGISPISVERLVLDQKSLEVGETAAAVKPDITEQFDDPTKIDIIKSDVPKDIAVESIDESVIKGEADKLASVTLDSEQGKVSDPALTAVVKHETLDASKTSSTETVAQIALVEEALDVKEVSIVEDKETSLAEVENAADITFAPQHDQTTTKELKKDVDHCEEKPNNIIEVLETSNANAEAADIDAKNLQELSKTESDNGHEKSSQVMPSPVISELPNNIHVTELKDKTEDVVASEKTNLSTDPKVLEEASPENERSKNVENVDDKLPSIDRSDSLEGNCGSVSALSFQSNTAVAETANSQSPDTILLETNAEKNKTTSEAETFEPPSFMTLVQSDNQEDIADKKAGWFPSLTNVSTIESEGRKKNEEIISKVTNWSPVRQHGSLKTLLNEVNSPKTKQVPAAAAADDDQKNGTEKPARKEEDKHAEEWDSPARYPIEINKETKKKTKPKSFWVPFLCCSSAHRDL